MYDKTRQSLVAVAAMNDLSDHDHVLWTIRSGDTPAGAMEFMLAYLLAHKRVKWIQNDPVGKGHTQLSDMFRHLADAFALDLRGKLFSLVETVFKNPQYYLPKEEQQLPLYYHALRFTAKMFADNGDDRFNLILDEKRITLLEDFDAAE